MAGEEIRVELEFFLVHLTELATNADSIERLRAEAPATLQPLFDRLSALKKMSIREMIDYLTHANEATREMARQLKKARNE
ncbi:MAG: hypothetical protein AB1631_10200 [Acidobacteriota bacterium]